MAGREGIRFRHRHDSSLELGRVSASRSPPTGERLDAEIDGRGGGSDREHPLDRGSAPIPATHHGNCCRDAQPQDRVVSRPREPAIVSVQLGRGGRRHSLVHGPVHSAELLQWLRQHRGDTWPSCHGLCEGVPDRLLRFTDALRHRKIVESRARTV